MYLCVPRAQRLGRLAAGESSVWESVPAGITCRPRRISLHHLHEGQFDLDFEAIRRAVAFDDLPIYLHESQLTEVYVDGTMLTEDTIHGTTLHFLRFSFSHSLLISYFQRFTCVSRTIVTRRCCLYDQ